MKRTSISGITLFIVLSLSGCSQWYYEFGDALPEGIEDAVQGQTMASVLVRLGPPLRFATADDQLLMAWEAWRVRESAVGVSLGFAGADFLNADWGSAKIEGDFLVMTFDAQRRVTAAERIRRDNRLGGGAAIQPLFSFVSVVDVEDLLLPLPQHRWGDAQLLDLPQVLNNVVTPGLGAAIEQRGTPTGSGARSLEWRD
ncbi:hypothetical protein [Congregibacter litoralis]|uniref:Uncharacterized protein n=1 Tax=Congregibacter litoralis KT71 TaxID=314285 RepID=A4AA97_9GAMM|nr:hypothetical protein [Congregibacter litoralis]EAQ96974.1 hypothetical protein KT71_11965 [Congregibacter litoralis KT71]